MIDWQHPTIQKLVDEGYRIAAHAYLQPGGRVNYTVVAKHPQTGRVVQGWSRGGAERDALADLEQRASSRLGCASFSRGHRVPSAPLDESGMARA